jgi:hypothetical protein
MPEKDKNKVIVPKSGVETVPDVPVKIDGKSVGDYFTKKYANERFGPGSDRFFAGVTPSMSNPAGMASVYGQNRTPGTSDAPGFFSRTLDFATTFASAFDKSQKANAGPDDKAVMEMQKLKQDIVNPIATRYEANSDIKDETSRAQAIAQVEQFLNDPNSYNNREVIPVIQKLMANVVRPEVKRLTGAESNDYGSIAGIINNVMKKGAAQGGGETLNEVIRGSGVLDPSNKAEYQNILDNFKDLSKRNFSNAVQPYKNMLENAGMSEFVPQVLRAPEGYELDYMATKQDITKVPDVMAAPVEAEKPGAIKTVGGVKLIKGKDGKWRETAHAAGK